MMRYYVARDGDASGPFDRDTLSAMAAAGSFTPESMVWIAGMADWGPAGEVADLAGVFAEPAASERQVPSEGSAIPPIPTGIVAPGIAARLPVFETLGAGLSTLAKRPLKALLAVTLAIVLPMLVTSPLWFTLDIDMTATTPPTQGQWLGIALVALLYWVFGSAFFGGLCLIMIDLARGGPAPISLIFGGFPRVISLMLFMLLNGLAVIAGMVLLVVPGVFLGVCLMLGPYIVMDSGLSAPAAMAASFRAVMGLGWWRCFALVLLLIVISLVLVLVLALLFGVLSQLSFADPDRATMLANVAGFLMNIPLSALSVAVLAAAYGRAHENEERRSV